MAKRMAWLLALTAAAVVLAGALNSDNARVASRLVEYENGRVAANVLGLLPLVKAPVMDGVIREGEWDAAAGAAAMRDFDTGLLLPSGKTALLRGGYDAENLYFLLVIPWGRPQVAKRDLDSMEIFRDGEVAEWMFATEGMKEPRNVAVSASGSMTDRVGTDAGFTSGAEWAVGGEARAAWLRQCGWRAPFHFIECRIPRASLGVQGEEFRFNLFHIGGGKQMTLAPVRKSAAEVENFVRVRLLREGCGFLASGLGNPSEGSFGIAGLTLPRGVSDAQTKIELLSFKRGSRFREDTGYDEVDGALEVFSRAAKGTWRRLKYEARNERCDWFELTLWGNGQVLMQLNGPLALRPPLTVAVCNYPSRRRVEATVTGRSVRGAVTLEALDAGGMAVWSGTATADKTLAVDCRDWKSGVYKMRAKAGEGASALVAEAEFRVR